MEFGKLMTIDAAMHDAIKTSSGELNRLWSKLPYEWMGLPYNIGFRPPPGRKHRQCWHFMMTRLLAWDHPIDASQIRYVIGKMICWDLHWMTGKSCQHLQRKWYFRALCCLTSILQIWRLMLKGAAHDIAKRIFIKALFNNIFNFEKKKIFKN